MIYVGTFSKVMFLRCASATWLFPEDLVAAFYHREMRPDQFSSTLYQAVMAWTLSAKDISRAEHFAECACSISSNCAALVEAI